MWHRIQTSKWLHIVSWACLLNNPNLFIGFTFRFVGVHHTKKGLPSVLFFLAGKLLTVELYITKSCLYNSPHIPSKINNCRNAKKKSRSSKTIIGWSVRSSWSGHFLYSLQPHLELGNIDRGFACCWLWFRHCWDLYVQLQKQKRQKIHQKHKMTVTLQDLYSICVCTKTKTSGKTHSTLAYTQCMPIYTVYTVYAPTCTCTQTHTHTVSFMK